MSQSPLPDEFVTICSCVQEEIKTNNSHEFLNMSSFICILSYDFFFLKAKRIVFYSCLHAIVFIEH